MAGEEEDEEDVRPDPVPVAGPVLELALPRGHTLELGALDAVPIHAVDDVEGDEASDTLTVDSALSQDKLQRSQGLYQNLVLLRLFCNLA